MPEVLREQAPWVFERLNVLGPELVAVHARPSESPCLLAYAYRERLEPVGARGLEAAWADALIHKGQ